MSLRGVPPDSSRACVQVAPPSVVHRITEEQVAPPQPYPTAVQVLVSVQETPLKPFVASLNCCVQVAPPSVVCKMGPALPEQQSPPTTVHVLASVQETPLSCNVVPTRSEEHTSELQSPM